MILVKAGITKATKQRGSFVTIRPADTAIEVANQNAACNKILLDFIKILLKLFRDKV